MIPHGPTIRAGFRRRPSRRRERASASPAGLSGVHFRFRPRLDFVEDRTLLSTFLVHLAGTLLNPVPIILGAPVSGPGAVTLADLNNNGILDLIVANSGGNNVLVYPGLGNGEFGPALNGGRGFFTGTNPVGITVADLNGDGRLDLVIADKGSNDVSILFNKPMGDSFTFVPGPRLEAGSGPIATAIANVNPDGVPDLLVADSGSNQVLLLQGIGGGFFNDQNPTVFPVGTTPTELLVGQFTGGSGLDLVTVNSGSNNVTLISGLGSAETQTQTISSGGVDPTAAFAVPLSGNGLDSLVVANSGDGNIALLQADETGLSIGSVLTSPGLTNPSALALASFSNGEVEFYAAPAGGGFAEMLGFNLSNGQNGVVTVDSGSNAVTSIPRFGEPNSGTSTIDSGGSQPGPAVSIGSISAFENSVDGNSGDGTPAFFEGGPGGLSVTPAESDPNLPTPTALALSALIGGRIRFYAAKAGNDGADLVSLNLAADTSFQIALPGPSNPIAQLVPSEGLSLPLVAVGLTMTIEVSGNELSLVLDGAVYGGTGAFLAGSGITVGQNVSSAGQSGGSGAPLAAGELTTGGAAAAHAPALPWERFVLGLDQLFDRFMRANPNGLSGALRGSDRPESSATQGSPAPGNPPASASGPAPPGQRGDHDGARGSNAAETSQAVDSIIQSFWKEACSSAQSLPAGRERALDPRIGGGPDVRVVTSWDTVLQAHDSPSESNVDRRVAMTRTLRGPAKDAPSLAAPFAFVVLANEWARWRLTSHLRRSHMRKETMT